MGTTIGNICQAITNRIGQWCGGENDSEPDPSRNHENHHTDDPLNPNILGPSNQNQLNFELKPIPASN
jgi:hypothetical protein